MITYRHFQLCCNTGEATAGGLHRRYYNFEGLRSPSPPTEILPGRKMVRNLAGKAGSDGLKDIQLC